MAVLELLFLLSATGAVVAEKKFAVGSPATLNCPQGVRYNDGCNWCDCQPEDGAISCTRRACVSILPDQRFDEEALTNKCPQGVNYKDDCNSCRCNPETGIFSCTRVACAQPITIPQRPKPTSSSQVVYVVEDSSEEADDDGVVIVNENVNRCPKGLNFKDDDGCNNCHCNPSNGAVGCTQMRCIKAPYKVTRPTIRFVTVPKPVKHSGSYQSTQNHFPEYQPPY